MFSDFYQGKRVLVTGHTGFKGAWLCLWLKQLGAEVWGYSLPPTTDPNFYELIRHHAVAGEQIEDIRNLEALKSWINRIQPEIVFHLAAQSLVSQSYQNPMETLTTNVLGTAHVLEGVRLAELACPIVIVTSDKCYENQGWEFGYRENDPMGGHDVYSMSKGAAELVVHSWRRSFFLTNPRLGPVASARAGNVIGGGDYAQNRIVPDCIRALIENRSIPVRNPGATRPWQHVLDCLSGYLWLGRSLAREGKAASYMQAFNFGPGLEANLPVSQIVEQILEVWPGHWHHEPVVNPPHEAFQLNLAVDKAAHRLKWFPTWGLAEATLHTVQWYRQRHTQSHPDMVKLSIRQIESFVQAARTKCLAWTASATP